MDNFLLLAFYIRRLIPIMLEYQEALLGGGGTCVPSLNLKYGRFAFWGLGHVPVGFKPIFMSFVAVSSSFMWLPEFYPNKTSVRGCVRDQILIN